ncbi:hypothetical protein BH09GEM1_BH09GEM1_01180 [soil metagenome]
MLTWMAYATLAGALLAAAGAMLERFSPWLAGHRRLLWLAVIGGTLSFAAAAATATSERNPTGVLASGPLSLPSTPEASRTQEAPRPKSSAPTVIERGPAAPAPQARAPLRPAPRDSSARVDGLLLMLWLAGTALCLAVLMISAWRVSRMRRTWRESVLAGVPVLVSHDVGPAVIGLVHHGIVVPAWVEALGADEQRTVMTHEREHVRAGDPLLLWGATLLVALAPWNAALWYALRRLRHAIEMDCDARVLRSRPDARAYCTLLLDVGERTLAGVAPVAALAEPATLLERRIQAMTEPLRVRRREVVASAAGALALVAVACVAPRPELAPAARVSALVTELSSLLARDSVRQSLSVADRSRIAGVLTSAAEGVQPSASTASLVAAARDSGFEGGSKVVQLARDSFPEAFQPREDAIVVLSIFDSHYRPVRNFVQRLSIDAVFDGIPGVKDSIVGTRNASYIISRVVPGWRPRVRMTGSQTEIATPRATFLWAVLMPGEAPPPPQDRRARRTDGAAPARHAATYGEALNADSIARSLYPSTYAPHDGLPVVGLIFSESGRLLRHGMQPASHDEVFVPSRDSEPPFGESARSGEELLSLVFTGVPKRGGQWSTIAHRLETAPVLVWTILPEDGHLPSPRVNVGKPRVADQTVSLAHREAQVTLSGTDATERWIRVYSGRRNEVEDGAIRGVVRDTLRVRLPSTLTIDIGPSGVTFASEDGQTFRLSALIQGENVPVSGWGGRIVLESSGAGLKAYK